MVTQENKKNEYYSFSDGFFSYYVNKDTGEKKFKLEENDICVDAKLDDFVRDAEPRGRSKCR